jgi:hypothetical protein
VLSEKLPALLDFHKDLVNLEASTKVSSFILLLYHMIPVYSHLDFGVCRVTSMYFHTDTIEIFGGRNASY